MKAVRYHGYGTPEVLMYEEIDRPSPGPDEVLVKVAGAGFNPIDTWIRAGQLNQPAEARRIAVADRGQRAELHRAVRCRQPDRRATRHLERADRPSARSGGRTWPRYRRPKPRRDRHAPDADGRTARRRPGDPLDRRAPQLHHADRARSDPRAGRRPVTRAGEPVGRLCGCRPVWVSALQVDAGDLGT